MILVQGGPDTGEKLTAHAERVRRAFVTGDEDAPAVAVVVDLAEHHNGTIMHLGALPCAVDITWRWSGGFRPPHSTAGDVVDGPFTRLVYASGDLGKRA